MYNEIRQFVSEDHQDTLCPKPLVPEVPDTEPESDDLGAEPHADDAVQRQQPRRRTKLCEAGQGGYRDIQGEREKCRDIKGER